MEELEVLIVGRYRPEQFSDLGEGVRIHLHDPEDRQYPPCLERIRAAVSGWFPPEWLDRSPRLESFFIPFSGLTPQLHQTLSSRPGLTVVNTHAASEFVAEHVFACLFQLNRNLAELDAFMRRPRLLRRSPPLPRIVTLRGQTMAILGYGHIGRAVETRARAFGMGVRLYTHADFRTDLEQKMGRLHVLLAESEVVVLTLPLTPETEGLIGSGEFAAMRRDALLINVSRGEIVCEKSFYEALAQNLIRGAAADTWYNYRDGFFSWDRPYTMPFGRLSNLLMTPHVGYRSDELEQVRVEEIKSFIRTVLRGTTPASLVNLNAGY